jgi:hypothetical protein
MLTRNYQSVLERIDDSGYVQESLTGAYSGMYTRTVGSLGRLFVATGEIGRIEAPVRYCLQSLTDNHLEFVPHVLGRREHDEPIPVIDSLAQVDGDAHVVLSWALLAGSRKRNTFEDETWSAISALLDRITRPPFLAECTRWRIEPGLVLNTHLEHSREGQYWNAYDFLTQSFVASALEKMIPIARRRGDEARVKEWTHRSDFLNRQIGESMVYELEGKKIYAEMLLPTGRTPKIFDGCGWLNLAPVPSGWSGVDPEILRNTIDLWHRNAALTWDGPSITACDWTPAGHSNETYGKMLGWDLLYSLQMGDCERVWDILEFLQLFNSEGLYGEIFRYDPAEKKWHIRDAGNGEQIGWLCWSLVSARNLLMLPPLPGT